MDKLRLSHGLPLSVLALVFTIGLTFASVELPKVVDSLIGENFQFPDVSTMPKNHPDYNPYDTGNIKTELYFKTYHLRWIGYGCLAAIFILIFVGFVMNKSGLSTAGAVVLFLPVFGHFALTMFFLGGLGFLRLIWMPFLDISFDVMRLGDIVVLPYKWSSFLYSLTGFQRWIPLSYWITGSGLLVFFLGTLTWFYSRVQKKDVADFWIYRFCRHPQYLGWIIWSYGVLFLPGSEEIKKYFEISNTLPWLLATMVIIGVSLVEEIKMKKLYGLSFVEYRRRTPFIFPLPRVVSASFLLPVRIFFKKDFPEKKREVFTLLAFCALFMMAGSAFYAGLIPLSKKTTGEHEMVRIEKLSRTAKNHKNAGERRHAIGLLGEMGESAVPALIPFLRSEDPVIRWNAATALGKTRSEKAADPLIQALSDEHGTVRSNAAAALGETGSVRAVVPLTEAFWDAERGLAAPAASALGKIGDRSVIPELERSIEEMEDFPYFQVGRALYELGSEKAEECFRIGLESDEYYTRSACVSELGKIKTERSLVLIMAALKDKHESVRRAAVLALMEIGSDRSVDVLKQMIEDEDFEVRMYAREALNRICNKKIEK